VTAVDIIVERRRRQHRT